MTGYAEPSLTNDERALLARGLEEWGGPATPTNDIAKVLGFSDVKAVHQEGGAIARSIRLRQPLTAADWRRALVATEIAFASDVIGSGVEWSTTTGFSDTDSIELLRAAQRKLSGLVSRA